MKAQKQLDTLACFNDGGYQWINCRLFNRSGKEIQPCYLPTGYRQYLIFNRKRGEKGKSVRVYSHVLSYLVTYGIYQEGLQIDHKDRDKTNDAPENLRAVTATGNVLNREQRFRKWTIKVIKGPQITAIRELHSAGHNQSYIARELNLNRISVRRAIIKIDAGEPFKYEGKE